MIILRMPHRKDIAYHSLWFKARSILFDITIVLLTYLLAVGIRTAIIDLDLKTLAFILIAAYAMPVLLYIFGVYNRLWVGSSGYGIELIASAVFIHAMIFTFADFIIENHPIPLTVVYVGNLLSLGGFVVLRFAPTIINNLMVYQAGIFQKTAVKDEIVRVMIVGAGEAGQLLYTNLRSHSNYRNQYFIVGYVDDAVNKQHIYIQNRPVLGKTRDIPELAEKHDIDLIIIAIANIGGQDFRRILAACQRTNARINIISGLSEYMNQPYTPLLRELAPEDLIGRSAIERHEAADFTPVLDKVVLITGACGSIGSVLSRQITAFNPQQVILLDVNESGLHDLHLDLSARHPDLHMSVVLGDIADEAGLRQVFKTYRPQVIFHAAAFKHVPILERFPNEAVRNNIRGTKNLVELAVEYGIERFVLISTDKAVKPSNVMGASKRICELLLLAYAQKSSVTTQFTSVRFGNVLGSRGSVVPIFEKQIKMGGPITITDPGMTRYFLSIPEAVNLVIHAACLTNGGDTFLLRMGDEVSITELAHRIIRMYGLRPDKDIPIVYTGVRPGEKLQEELYDSHLEKALPTVHPGIIRLHNEELERWDADLFLERTQHLLNTGIVDESRALEELTRILEIPPVQEAQLAG
ncbi:MAG: polysaccharide biosynthesis protein [Anaerolineae bacterium]|nr:polysaccharide biosynthesis protein [Anaerolineae bacterium]